MAATIHRRFLLVSLVAVAACKPTSTASLKSDPVTSDAVGAGGGATCQQQAELQGQEVPGEVPADPLSGLPAWSTGKVDEPQQTPQGSECGAPNSEGPKVTDFKKNPLYKETTAGAGAAALRLDETETAPADQPPAGNAPPPDANNPAGTGQPASSASSASTSGSASGAGPGNTAGDKCYADSQYDVKKLYGDNAGQLPACDAPNFTAWLKDLEQKEAARTGHNADYANALEAPKAPISMKRGSTYQVPQDTRTNYEMGLIKLFGDIKLIKNPQGANLTGDDPLSLLDDVDPTVRQPPAPGETINPNDPSILGINTEIDQLADDWARFENMDALFAGGNPGSANPNEGIALKLADDEHKMGQPNESEGGGLKGWEVGEGRFKIGFTAGFGAKYGADTNFGRDGTDKDLRPTGGEMVDDNTRSLKDVNDPFKTEKFKGLSVGGGPGVDVTVFGKAFKDVVKGYVKGQAFGNDPTKNGIELGFQLFGATLWKKNYLKCNKPKAGEAANGCVTPDDQKPSNKFQQKLAWLGRTARGLYNFTVGPVPMDAEWTAAPYVGYSWNIGAEMDIKGRSAKLVAGFYPRGKAAVSLAGGFSFVGQRAGIGGRLTLLNIGPSGQIGATAAIEAAGFRFCPFVKSTLDYDFLSGNLFAYAQIWYVFGSKYWELNLYSWKGETGSKPLFEVTPAACQAQAPKAEEIKDASADQDKPNFFKSRYNSDYCIDMDTGDTSHVYVHKCHGGTNQTFIFDQKDGPSGGVLKGGNIKTRDGQCLDLNFNEKSGNGFKLYLGECNNGSNQYFNVRENGTISDGLKGYCLDFDINRGDAGGYVLYSHPCHTENNQKWTIVPAR